MNMVFRYIGAMSSKCVCTRAQMHVFMQWKTY